MYIKMIGNWMIQQQILELFGDNLAVRASFHAIAAPCRGSVTCIGYQASIFG